MNEVPYRKTFLVLEDDANDAILIRWAFTNSACRAFVCRNTSEARAYLLGAGMYADRERFPFPEVFVTDLRLGDESGVEFLAWLRSQDAFKSLPVIVVSGTATPQDIRTLKGMRIDQILSKPSDPVKLEALLLGLAGTLCVPADSEGANSFQQNPVLSQAE
jgi:DNA-binding response OmpR family regulator